MNHNGLTPEPTNMMLSDLHLLPKACSPEDTAPQHSKMLFVVQAAPQRGRASLRPRVYGEKRQSYVFFCNSYEVFICS